MASASSGGSTPSTPASVPASSYDYFYFTTTGQTYSAYQVANLFGINPATASIKTLNIRGFYPVLPSNPAFDTRLYNPISTWDIVPITGGEGAVRVYTPDPKPLPEAKANGSAEAKTMANEAINVAVCDCGFSLDIITAAASQDPLDRPLRYQEELDGMTAISNQLDADLTAIDSATSVDEINAIVHKPYGVINTGRGGPGQAGPRDLNLSYFTEVNDLPGFTQADLELYVPGTDTTISYTDSLPEPYHFDSAGNCFNTNDWRLVIRYAGGGAVISTITVPQGANVNVPWVYNPNIPSGGSSQHSQA